MYNEKMRKRLMLAAGIFVLFLFLVILVASFSRGAKIDQTTARSAGDSFAQAYVSGNVKNWSALLVPSFGGQSPLNANSTALVTQAAAKSKTLFKHSKIMFVRQYVADQYPSDGYTVEVYDLSGTDHRQYQLSVSLAQQYDNDNHPTIWAVADYDVKEDNG